MLQEHINIFKQVAKELKCTIVLREPNKASEKHIGKGGYISKDTQCKAKTADDSSHHLGGMVVSPYLCPLAFKPETLKEAKEKWDKWLSESYIKSSETVPMGFELVLSGPDKGLVTKAGARIHADYDLMSVTPDKATSTTNSNFGNDNFGSDLKLLGDVIGELNYAFKRKMVQHGDDTSYAGVGTENKESLYVFYSNGQMSMQLSRMDITH